MILLYHIYAFWCRESNFIFMIWDFRVILFYGNAKCIFHICWLFPVITGYIHCEKNVSVSMDYRIYSLWKECFSEYGLQDIFIAKRTFLWVRIIGYIHCEKNVSVSTDCWICSLWKECFSEYGLLDIFIVKRLFL